jgi:hypothetical protein
MRTIGVGQDSRRQQGSGEIGLNPWRINYLWNGSLEFGNNVEDREGHSRLSIDKFWCSIKFNFTLLFMQLLCHFPFTFRPGLLSNRHGVLHIISQAPRHLVRLALSSTLSAANLTSLSTLKVAICLITGTESGNLQIRLNAGANFCTSCSSRLCDLSVWLCTPHSDQGRWDEAHLRILFGWAFLRIIDRSKKEPSLRALRLRGSIVTESLMSASSAGKFAATIGQYIPLNCQAFRASLVMFEKEAFCAMTLIWELNKRR